MGTTQQLDVNGDNLEVGAALIANRHLLINIANGITGCRCRAEDIVQDVFVKVSESATTEKVR
ncbi:MAG: hypothetical protein H7240_01085 [Glaciimonas sp.]|nr:hypothetical protein [Glaciimonas sp.]